MKDELRDLLNNIVSKESYGRVEDEDIDQAVDAILELFNKQLPKEKQKTFQGLVNKGTVQYAHLSGMKDGHNQCLEYIKRAAGLEE